MSKDKKEGTTKKGFHKRSKHRERYDFDSLIKSHPQLEAFVKENKYGDISIDFSDPESVLSLNTSILMYFYDVEYWELPKGYLCPPIPGRADYIHHAADLVYRGKWDKVKKNRISCLDIGVGANCIYPIIGVKEFNWSFVGTDIDPISIKAAKDIVERNRLLNDKVEIRLQKNRNSVFDGVVKKTDFFDIVICNPPFHSSEEEAKSGNKRKLSNLNKKEISNSKLNFGGISSELWCEGGEKKFISNMIFESEKYKDNCKWFTSLVSKKVNLPSIYKQLRRVKTKEVKTIEMSQGNKISRIVAWRF